MRVYGPATEDGLDVGLLSWVESFELAPRARDLVASANSMANPARMARLVFSRPTVMGLRTFAQRMIRSGGREIPPVSREWP